MTVGNFRYAFTVATPTFNRAHTLHRVFESLSAQTYRDFEWLVIDDGSADDTAERVARWQAQAVFPIRYLRQENLGKHVACNRAAREARGEFLLGIDSDDACVPQALERLKYHWECIPAAERARFCGVATLCVDEKGELVGSKFPWDVTDSDSIEIRYRHKVKGEKWGFIRTEVMRQFPFPEPANVRYVTEAMVFRAIAQKYKMRYVNEALRIYYCHDADQTSRLVHSAPRHAASMRLYLRDVLTGDLKWFRYAPVKFLRDAANYGRFGFDCGVAPLTQAAELGNPWAQLLWLAVLPVAYLYHLRDCAATQKYG
jgi:glycosyltransferase involved in cell wall biosynthesis